MKQVLIGVLVAAVLAGGATAATQRDGSLHATLLGKSETPKGDPDGSGTAEVKFSGARVCWEIKTARVGTILSAHIHKGRAGVAGPVVVPFGKTFKAKGCVMSTTAITAAIQRNPGGYYVNVHNAKYPAGALRGQLRNDG